MDASKTLEIYKILNSYFKNEEHATKVVQDIELIIENKFKDTKEGLASKEDMFLLKEDILLLKNDLEKKLNQHLIWTMATIMSVGGLIVAIIKLF